MLSRVEANPPTQKEAAADRARGAAFARLGVFRSFADAEALWRSLESTAVLTPYQRFDFLRLWHEHIGAREGVVPLIAVAFDLNGEPLCLLPLGKFARGPFPVARFLAGKHANYNFGLWRRGVSLSREFVERLIEGIAQAESDLAALELFNQPYSWQGVENPLTQLAHQPSPSVGYRLRLGEPGEAVLTRQLSVSYRSRLRGREKRLAKLPGYRYFVANTDEEVTRCLDAFFAQKRAHMQALRIPNPFDEPQVQAFLRAACRVGIQGGDRIMEIHALEGGGEVLALYAGVTDGKRYSAMVTSYTSSEHSKLSPGIGAFAHAVKNTADRGFEMIDLGVGEAEYKLLYCNETEELFDSFIPLSPAGHAIVPLLRAQAGLKRFVKTTPALWRAAKIVRSLLPR